MFALLRKIFHKDKPVTTYNDDNGDLVSRTVKAEEANPDPQSTPEGRAILAELQAFADDHTSDANIALCNDMADRLEKDGYTTEAAAWRSQASFLSVLGAFADDAADEEE